MKLLFDTNVLVDFLAQRQPFLKASSALIDEVFRGRHVGVVAFHSVTTVYYLIAKAHDTKRAGECVDWLLSHFVIASAGHLLLKRARELAIPDFEDAVIVASAEFEKCDLIITRDQTDFVSSSVSILNPLEFLTRYSEANP
jgi:predicted nucleic acid-binding protein